MSEELERSIRGKIADLQIFLASGRATEEDLEELDAWLEPAVEIINSSKMRDSKCGA